MNMQARRLFLILICFVLTQGMICDTYEKHLTGPYDLSAIDIDEEMAIYYRSNNGGGICRVPPTVFAVGWNKRYIIAKQHPRSNHNITNFYILDMKKDHEYAKESEYLIGPIRQNAFNQKMKELNLLGSLDFTIVYHSLK